MAYIFYVTRIRNYRWVVGIKPEVDTGTHRGSVEKGEV